MPAGVLLSVSEGVIENIPLLLLHSSTVKETTLFQIQENYIYIYTYIYIYIYIYI